MVADGSCSRNQLSRRPARITVFGEAADVGLARYEQLLTGFPHCVENIDKPRDRAVAPDQRPSGLWTNSFKLAAKTRDGALVRKRYHLPATPCQRLLADPRTNEEARRRVHELRATLDPVRLLQQIRAAQQQLVDIADRPALGETTKPTLPTLEEFLSGLRTA
jgi:hypothetical protein